MTLRLIGAGVGRTGTNTTTEFQERVRPLLSTDPG